MTEWKFLDSWDYKGHTVEMKTDGNVVAAFVDDEPIAKGKGSDVRDVKEEAKAQLDSPEQAGNDLQNPNKLFPRFYSFFPDEDGTGYRNELHYAVFGVNGPVWELRVHSDGETERFTSHMWDLFMVSQRLELEEVSWDESTWSDHYYR